MALIRGPLVYAYFQSWQEDPWSFHGRPGLYPGDVELICDPRELTEDIRETWAPGSCLGPALVAPLRTKGRPPLFARQQANRRLPGDEEGEGLLLPFVNRGARGGHYAVFLDYSRA